MPSELVISSLKNPRASGSKTYRQQRIISAPEINAGANFPSSLLKSRKSAEINPKPITVKATCEKSKLKNVETPVDRSSLPVSTVNHQNTNIIVPRPPLK